VRRTPAWIAALVLAVAAAVAAPSAATAAPVRAATFGPTPGWYSVPYADTLVWVRPGAPGSGIAITYSIATYEEWAANGFPAPQRTAVTYVKAPWLTSIMGVPTLPGSSQPLWGTHTILTPQQWARAGYPGPQVTTNIPGYILQYRQTAGDPTIWASIGSERHALTFAEWTAAGRPQPMVSDFPMPAPAPQPTVSYVGWSTSPELFTVWSDGRPYHKLTLAEWARAGYPAPTISAGGYYKLSWDYTIALLTPDGESGLLTAADWAFRDYPTPAVVTTIPGDEYCYDTDEGAVAYDGATVSRYLSDDEVARFLGVRVDDVPDC